ncbi:MAG: ABC transporter permease subunit [Acetobacteraceae bacterium]
MLIGFVSGAIVGTLLGLVMGRAPRINAVFDPLIEFLRPLPQLGYVVLLIVWFGIGETSRYVLLFLAALPVAAVAARAGVRNVSPQRIQVARTLGASERQIFWHVVFPSALAEIFTGARLAVGIVYATLIAAEIIAGSTGDRLDDPGFRALPALGLRVRRHHPDRPARPRARPGAGAGRDADRALGAPLATNLQGDSLCQRSIAGLSSGAPGLQPASAWWAGQGARGLPPRRSTSPISSRPSPP